MKKNKISCAIMAGGKNRRYKGKDKSFALVSGRPIIEIILETVDDIFEEIIIVTNNPEPYVKYDNRCKIVSDEIKNIGPLGGFYTAMINTDKDAVFYLPCDMPFIKKEIIEKQIDFFYENDCEVLQPKIGDLLEPMHSIYKTSLSLKLYNFLQNAETYSILTFLRQLNVSEFILENNKDNLISFFNINSEKELDKILSKNEIESNQFIQDLNKKRINKAKVQDYIAKNILN